MDTYSSIAGYARYLDEYLVKLPKEFLVNFLLIAIKTDCIRAVRFLVLEKKIFLPNLRYFKQRTPLHMAALHNSALSLAFLIKEGMDPEVIDEDLKPAMELAKEMRANGAVRFLTTYLRAGQNRKGFERSKSPLR